MPDPARGVGVRAPSRGGSGVRAGGWGGGGSRGERGERTQKPGSWESGSRVRGGPGMGGRLSTWSHRETE